MKIQVPIFGMALSVCFAAAAQAQVLTAAGPYYAVTDRNTYLKPTLPALGPAGTKVTDPVFQSPITRLTDAATRPGFLNYSYRTASSPHQNEWSAGGSYFYVVTDDGTAVPFRFDATTGTAHRINPTSTGAGGLVLSTYVEPQFSYLNDSIIYVADNRPGSDLHTLDQYDFSTGVYTPLIDLESVVGGLAGTYIGGIASSAGPTERIETFFGGTSQDHHHYVLVFDPTNPSTRLLLDTWASTINGQPTSTVLNFSLHHVAIDRSGRYVMLYTTAADQSGPRQAPQSYVWDTQTGSLFAMVAAVYPYGHDALGYGVSVNQDCCTTTTWDAAQWQFRSLATPAVTRDVLPTVLTPKEVYLDSHTTWNDASPTALVPFVTASYRYGTNTVPWRALDDEIFAVETDVPGQNPTIWRFAHHRSDIRNDLDATTESFWYEPRPNVSDDGQWVLFTSNWEKTLGTDPVGESGAAARQDVFLLQLRTTGAPLGAAGSMTPYYSASTTAGGCTTPDPFSAIGGGTCANGGWLPLGMVSTASAPTTSAPAPVAPAPSTSSSACTTPDPFMAIGGGTCVNGGWLPAGMGAPASSTPPSSTPTSTTSTAAVTSSTTSSASCTIPDPFVSIGGGTCVNGGWIPGHVAISPATSPSSSGTSTSGGQAPTFGGCTIPDPFVSIGGGLCVNGGWIPKQ